MSLCHGLLVCILVANWLYTGYNAHFAFSLRFWLDSESKQVLWISVSVDCNRFDHLQLHIEFILLLFYCFLSWLWPSSKQPFQRQRDHFCCDCSISGRRTTDFRQKFVFVEMCLGIWEQPLNSTYNRHTDTHFPPSMFGLRGVWPGAGGSDVRIWDGAILHPQGVTTLSCKGRVEGDRDREGEEDTGRIKIWEKFSSVWSTCPGET